VLFQPGALDNGRDRSIVDGIGYELMPVVVGSLQGKEDRIPLYHPRINADISDGLMVLRVTAQLAADNFGEAFQAQVIHKSLVPALEIA
jgi:phage baseplate assembly protein W